MPNLHIIKSLCDKQLITIDQLCEKIGLKRGSIYKMMSENSTKIETLEKISKVLNVPVSIFFDDDTSLTNQTIITTKNETEMTTIGTKSIEELIRQNSVFQQQVSDLLKMQLLNADTINNLSQGLKKKAS